MRLMVSLGILAVAVVLLMAAPGVVASLGLEPYQLARLAMGLCVLIVSAGWFARYRGGFSDVIEDMILWAAIIAGVAVAYAYRFAILALAQNIFGIK